MVADQLPCTPPTASDGRARWKRLTRAAVGVEWQYRVKLKLDSKMSDHEAIKTSHIMRQLS